MFELNKLKIFSAVMIAVAMGSTQARAQAPEQRPSQILQTLIRDELSKKIADSRVELRSDISWVQKPLQSAAQSVSLIEENARGEAHFLARAASGEVAEGWVRFSAWLSAPVAIRRILPGERLSSDLFSVREVDVSVGLNREYRGAILPAKTDFSTLEARQTVMEGTFPVSNGVRKIPDVRSGDAVRLHIVSGALVLSTQGTATEAAYLNSRVRVISAKNKREFVGELKSDGVVEVRL